MKIILEGTPKEIADLVVAIQGQLNKKDVQVSIDGVPIYSVGNHD